MSLIQRLIMDERAATSIEYALIATLISITLIAGARSVGTALQAKFFGPIASNLT